MGRPPQGPVRLASEGSSSFPLDSFCTCPAGQCGAPVAPPGFVLPAPRKVGDPKANTTSLILCFKPATTHWPVWLSWLECHPLQQKVTGLMPSQGMYQRQPISVSISPPPFLPLLKKKSIKKIKPATTLPGYPGRFLTF